MPARKTKKTLNTEESSSKFEGTFYPQRVVLDTSLFVNPDVRRSFADTPTEALEAFLFLAAQIHILEFYMPPSIFEELLHFVEKNKIPEDLLLILNQKPPKKHELKCPAFLLYELIEDILARVNERSPFSYILDFVLLEACITLL